MTRSRNATPSASPGPAPSTTGSCATSTIWPRCCTKRSMSPAPDGPVLVDVPKDVQFAVGTYHPPRKSDVHVSYAPRVKGDAAQIRKAVALLASAKRPVIYSGGGVINSGPEASRLLRELVEATG